MDAWGVYTRNDTDAFTRECARLPVKVFLLFADTANTWGELANPWFLRHYRVTPYLDQWLAGDKSRKVVATIGLGLNSPAGQAGLAQVTADPYSALAATLARRWPGQVSVRLGHEMNRPGGYPWASRPGDSDWGRAYVAAFRTAAAPLRAAGIPVEWCVNNGFSWAGCYPGDDVVDIIGCDPYGGTWATAPPSVAQIVGTVRDGAWWLGDVCRLARLHGKPVALTEWASATPKAVDGKPGPRGLGDSPEYVDAVLDTLAAHKAQGGKFAHGIYWGVDEYAIDGYPRTLAALQRRLT